MSRDSATSPPETPVVVVGAGPVGLALALELAAHGVHCVLLEARTQVSWQRPRAKTTSARTMEYFRRWGIAATVRERAPLPQAWSHEVVFCTTLLGREVTRFADCFGLELVHDELAAEGGQQIAQPLVESIMREQVERSPHITFATGVRVTGLSQDADGVTVALRDGEGRTREVRARFAVGADGARSLVREAIGVRMEGVDDTRANYNLVFRSPRLADLVPHGNAVQYWVLNPKQPGLIGRLDLDETWWCIALGVEPEQGATDPEALVRDLLGDDEGSAPLEIVAGDPWRARMQLAEAFRVGRVFLVGDAAHLNPPWGGHGFNTGVGDAVNLGWKLAAVVGGWAPEALLESYEAERRAVAEATIEEARRNMGTLASELADPRLIGDDEQFARAQPAAREAIHRTKDAEFHSLDLVLGTAYPQSPIVHGEQPAPSARARRTATAQAPYVPTAAPGHRLPHTWLRDDESLYDLLGLDFNLVGDLRHPAARALAEAAEQMGVPLRCVEFARGRELFDAAVVLVRPDLHVAWRGSTAPDAHAVWRRVLGFISYAPSHG